MLDPSAAILVLRIVSRRQSTQAEGGGGGLPIPESHSMAPALCSSESAGRHTTREFCGPRDETDARSIAQRATLRENERESEREREMNERLKLTDG